MEPNNNDFQSSEPKSHSYPKTRTKLSIKHCARLQHRKKCDLQDLYSPVSCYVKRNTSTFEADPVETILSEQDDVGSNKMSDMSEQIETTSNEDSSSNDQNINPITCLNSEPTIKRHKALNYNINKSALDNSAIKIFKGNPAHKNEGTLQEFRNECITVIEHGSGLIKDSSDETSDQNQCVSFGERNKTDYGLKCVGEVHSSYEDGTRRHFKCPLCWKTFEKHQTHMLHMKACASQHNVTTRQLLDAVALQERQAAERQALGLPDIPSGCTAKKSSRKSGGTVNDSNLQLALALSASVQEAKEHQQLQQDDCLLEAGLGHEVVERQQMMLERFGFKRSCPAVLAPSTSRHKTAQIPTVLGDARWTSAPEFKTATKNKSTNAVLMNRTKEERERLITEKVAIVLIGEEGTPPSATADIPQNNQPAEGIVETNKNLQKYEDKSHSLWNMGSVSLSEKGFQSHYVKELSKIISPSKVPAGAKLKHLSQIPGRSKTPEKTSHILWTEGDTCSLVSRGTLVQTKTDDRKETEAAEEIRPKARQSFVDRLTDESPGKNSFTEMLISDWKSLLNKKAMSDLTIYVERDEEIPGHRLVFYVRCRAILKDIVSEVSADATKKTSDMLLWVDVSYTAALAFLEFLYCGLASEILWLDEDDLSNVKRLAQRYRFTELLQYLQVVNNVRSRVNESTYFSASSLPQVLTPHQSVSRRRKRNSLHPSNQCTGFLAICSPKKQMYSEDTFSSHKLSTELTEKSVCSVSSKTRDISNEFHDSAESKLCSNARLSPDLFMDDEGEYVETSQENRSSMDYLLSMIGKSSLSQSHSQTNFTEISSDKPTCPNTSSVDPSTSHLKNDSLCVTAISDEVSIQNDSRISYSSQSHDKKSTSPDKDLICIEHHDDIQDKCDFLTATLVPRSHATPESVSTISPVKTGAQRNVSGINYENHRQSSQPKEVHNECIRFENPQEDTANVESASDGIDFLEHLLLDSHSNYMQGDIKGRVESKRKHTESDTVSDHCSSLTKKLCSDGSEHENVETFFDTTELQEQSDKFRTLEDDVTEIIDLTQDSIDSESPLTPPIRASIVRTDMETEHNSPSVTKEYSKITVCNDLFKKSDDSSTTDQTTKSVHLDSDSKSGVEENTTSVEQKEETLLVYRLMKLDNWDKFDEMCNAPLPQIFSQCLTQMISSQPTSKKSLKSSTSSNKCRISENSGSRSLRLSPSLPKYSVQETPNYSSSCSSSPVRKPENVSEKIKEVPSREQESLRGKDVLDNLPLVDLNKSVFWRDENEPTLRIAPKQTAHSDHSNIAEHRTPTRKQMHVKFSDRVTPSADYSAMKTPQLKKELKKYGLKPSLSKRHAKIMLRYIYDQLHPYVSVSDSEVDVQESEVELSPFKKPGSDTQVPRSPVWKDNNLGTSGSSARKNIMRTEVVSHEGCPVTQRRNSASQSDTGSDSDDLLLSQESSSSAQSVAEETFCEELDDLSQGNVSSSQDACSSADLATVVHNFITSDPDLHQKVLLYEPIWIEKLHADLKANNFKFKTNQLMEYLDEQCITFRTAQGQRNRQRKKLMKDAKRRKLTKRKKDSNDV